MHEEVNSSRRNLRTAYISALQFEANLIQHEDHILLKIIVLLQINAIILALDYVFGETGI